MGDWKARMARSVRHLAGQLAGIRPGAVGVGFVETVRVSIGGQSIPIGRLAAVTGRGDRLLVRPFDPAHLGAVVKALQGARLSAYALDPTSVGVGVPPISGEQRQEMARHVKALGEEAKVAVRMVRQDARKEIAARGRGSLRAVQDATDAAIAEIDRSVRAKLDELGG